MDNLPLNFLINLNAKSNSEPIGATRDLIQNYVIPTQSWINFLVAADRVGIYILPLFQNAS